MSHRSTVIIPHYNQVDDLSMCLYALCEQQEECEIIVVDNGTPGLQPDSFISKYCNLTWLTEISEHNPYALRNKGIDHASGDYIFFLDAKCRPRPDWLPQMTMMLAQNDLVAGRYKLDYASDELRDKVHGILYLNNKKNVREGYGIGAGNLGVRRQVFEEIGVFSEAYHSGGDIMWSKKAVSKGYRLAYVDSAIVEYRSPSWQLLLQKVRKYGAGASAHGVEDESWKKRMPLSRKTFKEALQYRGLDTLSKRDKLKLWYYASVVKQQYYDALRKG